MKAEILDGDELDAVEQKLALGERLPLASRKAPANLPPPAECEDATAVPVEAKPSRTRSIPPNVGDGPLPPPPPPLTPDRIPAPYVPAAEQPVSRDVTGDGVSLREVYGDVLEAADVVLGATGAAKLAKVVRALAKRRGVVFK